MAEPVFAQQVGDAFVQHYYSILEREPGLACKFYKDISKLGRPAEDGTMTITTTMQAINEKIASLNYTDFTADIRSVDAQESLDGGLHVLVTGSLTGKKDRRVRKFSQTFFLAPQKKGYFVLNDIFRYIDDEDGNHEGGIQEDGNLPENRVSSPEEGEEEEEEEKDSAWYWI